MKTLFPEVRPIAEHAKRWAEVTDRLRILRNATCYTILTTGRIAAKIELCKDVHSIQLALDCALRRQGELLGDNANAKEARRKHSKQFVHLSSAAMTLSELRQLLTRTPSGAAVSQEDLRYMVATLENLSRSQRLVSRFLRKSPTHWIIPSLPARDAASIRQGQDNLPPDPDDIPYRLHRQVYNTEIPAAEACAAMLVRFADAPEGAQNALARQVSDEGRHAAVVLAKLLQEATRKKQYPINFSIWSNAYGATTLAEAFCIEQVIGEGFGLGNDLFMAARYRRLKRTDLAEMQSWIHADEVNHARVGIQWFRQLAGAEASELLSHLEKQFVHKPIAGRWFMRALRCKIGFTHEEIDRQHRMAQKQVP
ncbi:MAG TPA: DUF455 family protein [Thermoanaerobaculia bacterium]|nr:DUF455 family protein [Thermoanaerobaculia bacterium]